MIEEPIEKMIRSAKPGSNEIAPLSPEKSNRILHAALRANRRTPKGSWLGMPLRVAVGAAAFGVMAFALQPLLLVPDATVGEPVTETTPRIAKQTQETPKDAQPASTSKSPGGSKTPVVPSRRPVKRAPSILPKQLQPQRMLASHTAPRLNHTRNEKQTALHQGRNKTGPQTIPSPVADEPSMYVSVSGANALPPTEAHADDLIVTVTNNVPDSVPGTAEAASLQAVVLPQDTANREVSAEDQMIPVWAHAHVESGEESTVTMTALR